MNMSPESSLDSLIAWRDHRDQVEARRLVRELSPLLHSVALRSLPFAWMSDDAVQMTWMKFFRSLEAFDPRIPVSAWLTSILKRVCWNMRRSFHRHEGMAHNDLHLQDFELIAPMPSPREHSMIREKLSGVLTAMEGLRGSDRLIMHALAFSDDSPAEIAQRTGLSAGAVRVRACRLRATMRNLAA